MPDVPLIPTIGAGRPGGPPVGAVAEPVELVLDLGTRFRLSVFDLGLACCAVEVVAAATARRLPLAAAPGRGGAVEAVEVLVVAGTVTDKLAPAVARLHARLPDPTYVISFGSCANCGGPYWDSYCVTKGVDQLVPVDVYVPGCPPRPEALLAGVRRLADRIDAGIAPGAGRPDRPFVSPPPAWGPA